jgi:hypothetical protein
VPEVEWLQFPKISGGITSRLLGGMKYFLREKRVENLKDPRKPNLKRNSDIMHRKAYARSVEGRDNPSPRL